MAKRVAEMLNGQPMGGPRRSAYHYDLWNLKYLHKFKWDNLTEEIGKHETVLLEQGALLGRFAQLLSSILQTLCSRFDVGLHTKSPSIQQIKRQETP